MSRPGGFALLSVLWLTLALSVVLVTATPPIVRAGRRQDNAAQIIRARWAALACVEVVKARTASGALRAPSSDTIVLGPTVGCRLERIATDERINPNLTDSAGLMRVLADTVRVASLLDWVDADDRARSGGGESEWYRLRGRLRPRNGAFASVAEMGLVRGFEEADPSELDAVFTTMGDGRVSPTRAPPWALRSISGLSSELIDQMLLRRRPGDVPATAERLAGDLALRPSIDEFRAMVRRLSFDDATWVLRAVGFVDIGRMTLEAVVVATVRVEGDGARVRRLNVE